MKNKTHIRVINFIVDTLIYFLITLIIILGSKSYVPKENVKWISMLIYFLYYFILEYFWGQTIGKMITKSKVISLSNDKKNYFYKVLIRTLARFVPIDIITYLFSYRGLHDWISKTIVVKL